MLHLCDFFSIGGSQSEAEVRQKQQLQLMQSKYQQKVRFHLFQFNFGKEFEYLTRTFDNHGVIQ